MFVMFIMTHDRSKIDSGTQFDVAGWPRRVPLRSAADPVRVECSADVFHERDPTRAVPLWGASKRQALVAQRIRASDYGSEGWGFESLRAHQISAVQRVADQVTWIPLHPHENLMRTKRFLGLMN